MINEDIINQSIGDMPEDDEEIEEKEQTHTTTTSEEESKGDNQYPINDFEPSYSEQNLVFPDSHREHDYLPDLNPLSHNASDYPY